MDATKSPPRTGASSLAGGREPADGVGARNRSAAGQIVGLVRSMRPHQWTKNVFVFAALIFAQRFDRSEDVLRTLAAFALFCALSGAVYIINDLVDREKDRAHARKRLRPIASGRVSPAAAAVFATILVVASLGLAFALDTSFGVVAATYFAVNLFYSFYLKRLVILDVMTIAFGFVLRAVAGAEVIHVPISPWLILCTSLLALFLGFCKRRHELTYLQAGASGHRESLREYNVAFLDQMIAVVTASTVIAYALYAMSPEVQEKLHTNYLGVTVPFVLYGIFRYLYVLNMKGEGGSPSQVLIEDKPLLLNVILWMATCVVLLYFRL
jgi:4-hydroxybenzoate polyprenyltransferase